VDFSAAWGILILTPGGLELESCYRFNLYAQQHFLIAETISQDYNISDCPPTAKQLVYN
jgi:coenzyme F420-reducing hydrogenase gamma subunit